MTLSHIESRIAELKRSLSASGGRITLQRDAVIEALVLGGHCTAEQVQLAASSRTPGTSLATVYKTIEALKALGEVSEIEVGDGKTRFDAANKDSHAHLVCTFCGRIEDLWTPKISELEGFANSNCGFATSSLRVELFGICRNCVGKRS